MTLPTQYWICFKVYDPASKSERQVRLPIWAVSQRHAYLSATLVYPHLVEKAGFEVRPRHNAEAAA